MADIAATLGGITAFIKQAKAKMSGEKETFEDDVEAGVVVVFLIVYFAIVILVWAAAFYLASACQRMTVEQRYPIVEALLAHEVDKDDHNLPLMYWYATEPIVAADPAKGALLLAKAKIPLLREYITRRLTTK